MVPPWSNMITLESFYPQYLKISSTNMSWPPLMTADGYIYTLKGNAWPEAGRGNIQQPLGKKSGKSGYETMRHTPAL